MSADAIPQEIHELLKRAATAGAELLAVLPEQAADYAELDPRARVPEGDQRAELWGRVELIAERWRDAESVGATLRELVDEGGMDGAYGLLGAIQDSLVLSLSEDPAVREMALAAQEVTERTLALERDGVFGGGPLPPAERGAGQRPASDAEDAIFEELSDVVLAAHGDNMELYARLRPDGRALNARDAEEARRRVEETARAARAIDAEQELVRALSGKRDLRPDLDMLRATQQGLVLALSEDPARRSKAIPMEELGSLWKPPYERWKAELPGG